MYNPSADDFYVEQATPEYQTGGCLFGLLPPLAVLVISCLLSLVAMNTTSPVFALSPPVAAAPDTNPLQSQSSTEPQPVQASVLAPLFTTEVLFWEEKIVKWAKEWDLDPNLVATVMQIESCGDPEARSSAGAMGLFQVMPFHFSQGDDPYKPQTNAKRGLAYLRKALEARDGDARLALASYNGGITGGGRAESQWPEETRRYAYWGGQIYADAAEGRSKSARLEEWLSAGGASLCAQASERLSINQ